MSCSQLITSFHFFWDLWHLLRDTNPTNLWCNDFSSIHLVERIERRNLYVVIDVTWALHKYGPQPILFLTTRRRFHRHPWSEDDDALGASCSNLAFFLNLSGCSSCAVSDPLLQIWMSLILFSSCWFSVMSPPDAPACRTATCSSSFSRGSTGTSSAHRSTQAVFSLSFTRSVSAILSLYAFIRVFSRQCSLNDRSDSFSAFVIMLFCRSSVRCKRSTTRTTSSDHESKRRIFSAQLPEFLPSQSLAIGVRSFFVSCNFLCQFYCRSHHLPRSVT